MSEKETDEEDAIFWMSKLLPFKGTWETPSRGIITFQFQGDSDTITDILENNEFSPEYFSIEEQTITIRRGGIHHILKDVYHSDPPIWTRMTDAQAEARLTQAGQWLIRATDMDGHYVVSWCNLGSIYDHVPIQLVKNVREYLKKIVAFDLPNGCSSHIKYENEKLSIACGSNDCEIGKGLAEYFHVACQDGEVWKEMQDDDVWKALTSIRDVQPWTLAALNSEDRKPVDPLFTVDRLIPFVYAYYNMITVLLLTQRTSVGEEPLQVKDLVIDVRKKDPIFRV